MADAPTDAPVPAEVLLLVGPPFLGAMVAWLLGGISVVQLYFYAKSFPNDRAAIKGTVYLIFVLDIFQGIVCVALAWQLAVGGWGRQSQLVFPGWTFSATPGVDGPLAFIVQAFYAWRIWVLKQWVVIPVIILAVSTASLIGAWIIAFGTTHLTNIAQLHPFFPKTVVWLGGASLADIMIAVTMVYILTRAKNNSASLQRSTQVIDRLIMLSVETGAITAICALTQLCLFLTSQTTNLHVFFALILGKLYSNSLYTSLNARALNRGLGDSYHSKNSMGAAGASVHISGTRRRSEQVTTVGSAPVVHVATQRERFVEADNAFVDMSGKHHIEMNRYDSDSA